MARKIRIGTASRDAGSVRRRVIRSRRLLLAGPSICVSPLIRGLAPEHRSKGRSCELTPCPVTNLRGRRSRVPSPIGHILFSNGQDRGIRHSSFRAIVEAYAANSFPPQRSWGGAVLSVAHDPSGPEGHLPSFAEGE